jgi:ABC-type phosphate transport system substrate-binding protein
MRKKGIIMKQLQVCAVALFLSLASANVWAQARSYKVIVNPSNPVSSMTRENLSRIFLKKTTRFPDGRGASPVDLPVNSSTRENFSKDVHGKPSSAVDAYWQQLIFSGRDIPPAQKSESGALDFVRSNENGIGYVSAGADTAGVKTISVTD